MLYKHTHDDWFSMFNPEGGLYIRSGIIENGRETEKDPFMAPFPELLDVGIMGHCIHGKTGLCLNAGVECYQNGNSANSPNMTFENFRILTNECAGKTYQFALGGAGDPNQHEHFEAFLKTARDAEIVPSYTTSGFALTEAQINVTKKYCGAVAVSWYRGKYTLNAIEAFKSHGVKTNIHYCINKNTIDEAITRLRENSFPDVNAIVFLLHKPVGLGTEKNVLSLSDPRVDEFFTLCTTKPSGKFKIGFDSCSVPYLVQHPGDINRISIDTCEAGRWSAYVTPDMKLLPCSFDQERRWAVDILSGGVEAAWNSKEFEEFRSHFKKACPKCPDKSSCMGGCPICPNITLCNKKERSVEV